MLCKRLVVSNQLEPKPKKRNERYLVGSNKHIFQQNLHSRATCGIISLLYFVYSPYESFYAAVVKFSNGNQMCLTGARFVF